MSNLSQIIPTPEQTAALAISMQQIGRTAQQAADALVDAFAAAARQLELERRNRLSFGRKRRARRARGRARASGHV